MALPYAFDACKPLARYNHTAFRPGNEALPMDAERDRAPPSPDLIYLGTAVAVTFEDDDDDEEENAPTPDLMYLGTTVALSFPTEIDEEAPLSPTRNTRGAGRSDDNSVIVIHDAENTSIILEADDYVSILID